MSSDLQRNKQERSAHITAMREQFGFSDRDIVRELRDELSVLDSKNGSILSTASILFVGYTIILNIGHDRLQERGVLSFSVFLLFLFIFLLGRQMLKIAHVRWSRYDLQHPTDYYFDELLAVRNARTKALRSTYWVMTLLTVGLIIIFGFAVASPFEWVGALARQLSIHI
ncbi:MAG: hypothetical protein WCA81_11730 [Rhizomicrobium sp.]